MPTPAELLDEIQNGTLSETLAPLVQAGNDTGIADELNKVRPGITLPRSVVPRAALLAALGNPAIAGLRPLYEAVGRIAGVPAAPSPVYDLALAAVAILDDANGEINYADPNVQAMVAALGPAGVSLLSQNQTTAVQTACMRIGSRAEQVFGAGVAITPTQVAAAFGRI